MNNGSKQFSQNCSIYHAHYLFSFYLSLISLTVTLFFQILTCFSQHIRLLIWLYEIRNSWNRIICHLPSTKKMQNIYTFVQKKPHLGLCEHWHLGRQIIWSETGQTLTYQADWNRFTAVMYPNWRCIQGLTFTRCHPSAQSQCLVKYVDYSILESFD